MNSYVGDSRVTHVAMCRAAAWAVRCLQIFARTGQGQSATVSDPRPGHRSRSRAGHTAQGPGLMTLRSDCAQVTRISVQLARARALRTFQLYLALSQAPAP